MRLHQQEWSPHVPREDREARKAFTLTELLVVIAIIAILSALGAWGVFAMIGTRQKSSSEVSMRVINKMMQDRWAAVVADAKKETPSPQVMNLANNDVERARVIWVKVRLIEAFPVRYAETSTGTTVVSTYILPASRRKPHFAKYQQTLGSLTGGTPGESSACLLMALKTLQADSVAVDEQLKPAIASTDGTNAINTLIDGWNRPIVFERFYIGAPNPAPAASRNAKFGDPNDNDGRLLTGGWYKTIPAGMATLVRNTFEKDFGYTISPDNGLTASYVIPKIASSGRDGQFGTPDDIYSFMLRGD